LAVSPATAPGWGEVVRFAVGPAARSPIVWALIGAAVLPLLLGTGVRLAWAARLWAMACLSWAIALASTHEWMGSFTPSETVVLAPAAVAVAAAIGLGIASFENDLPGQAFGWRQLATGLALAATVIGLLPVAAGAVGGRWDLPSSGVEQPLAFLDHPGAGSTSWRVLWLGDPRALPVGGWSIDPGLAYGLTVAQLPSSAEVWTPAGPGPADTVAGAVRLAIEGETVHLGRLLAAAGVRYVVVVDGLAPSTGGLARPVNAPAPSGLARALLDQSDLRAVPGEFGVSVFENAEALPVAALRAPPPLAASPHWTFPGVADIQGWHAVLGQLSGPSDAGQVTAGELFASDAPAGNLRLVVDGHAVAERPAFGWAAQFDNVPAGRATLNFNRLPFIALLVLVELAGWAALGSTLLGIRRRRVRHVVGTPGIPEDSA
jgi:hypothetical protein